MKRLGFFLFLSLFSFYVAAQTVEPRFEVTDIRVEGLLRVSSGTVFSALPIRIGDVVDQESLTFATRELFQTGYFDDITIGREGGILVINVEERPAISEINLEGNKALKTDDLMGGLEDNGLAEGQIFKRATLEGLSQELQRQYESQGRYGAAVKSEVVPLPNNQVRLNITIDEGKEARIKHINIVGNDVFDEEILVDLFEVKTSGWLSWLSGNDKYSTEKLTGDLERLESYYLDRGYLEFNIDSAPVSISPNREEVYITVNITEGDVYTVDKINLSGDPILEEEVIRQFIVLREGQVFSQLLMTTTSDFITQRLGNEGYTFAETRGIPELNEEDKTVDVTFFIEPGQRAYVRRIEFRGNTQTADEVLRREMRQMEGASASTRRIEQSKVQLERLGFFKEVEVETNEVPGTADQIDVQYTVEEAPAGQFSFQVGYANDNWFIGAGVSHNNWFGTGKQVDFSVNTSPYQTAYSFSYNDPYFTPDGVSRGFSVFYQKRDYEEINVSRYSTDQYGARVSFGYPLSDTERLGFGFGYTNIEIQTGEFAVQEIVGSPRLYDTVANQYISLSDYNDLLARLSDTDTPITQADFDALTLTSFSPEDAGLGFGEPGFIDRNGDQFNLFTTNLSWIQRALNRGQLPNRGYSQNLSFELSLPGGDLEYYKLQYDGQLFVPLTQSLTLRFRTELGYVGAYGDSEEVPFFEHFYAGGLGTVRGFDRNTLGPRATPAELFYPSRYDRGSFFPGVPISPIFDDEGTLIGYESGPEDFAYVHCDQISYVGSGACRPDRLGLLAAGVYGRSDEPRGGNVKVIGSAELLFPLPFIKDQRLIQSAFFVDAGNVFDTECDLDRQLNCAEVSFDNLSASVGIGVTWINGFAPMTFSLARPIKEQPFDETKRFEFSLGRTF